jgi:hypothetical protein
VEREIFAAFAALVALPVSANAFLAAVPSDRRKPSF